ncbi:uncharacterized protein LOC114731675 [Neltuma alba]|uniref:uncharacterized protein LOC114731675 n=1 Tax=Neltuma alba TaxID=207710 RepID=UPI0010A2D306|nr:uncharacterized protein LOC114731675 [Prosopis alba]
MGCASSKRIESKVDVYRPAPASFAVFDINAIEEPWLKLNSAQIAQEQQDKASNRNLPPPLLQKLNKLETTEAPQSWAELSKALDDLKPNLADAAKPVVKPPSTSTTKQAPQKSTSFRTLEELDAKLNPKPNKGLRKTESMRDKPKEPEEKKEEGTKQEVGEGFKSVKDNIFVVRDRMEREKEGKQANYDRIAKLRRDPLSDFPEKCPPGGMEGVVIYTTSLGGVRKTFEDCNRVREVLESHRVVYDERDVSLHGEFLKEMKEMVGEGVTVPRVFVKGRYIGGAEEVVELNESGRLGRILNATRVERGIGRQACEGCGGARFVPCLECGGSCKVIETAASGGEVKRRCPHCNENGLVHCPACL